MDTNVVCVLSDDKKLPEILKLLGAKTSDFSDKDFSDYDFSDNDFSDDDLQDMKNKALASVGMSIKV